MTTEFVYNLLYYLYEDVSILYMNDNKIKLNVFELASIKLMLVQYLRKKNYNVFIKNYNVFIFIFFNVLYFFVAVHKTRDKFNNYHGWLK